MDQAEEKQPAPLPVEPGHVMSREKYRRLVEQQKQKQK
jgi:hypothetical protein